MAERIIIVHSQSVRPRLGERYLPLNRLNGKYKQFAEHTALIKEVRTKKRVVEFNQGDDLKEVASLVQPGDNVILYGLWTSACLKTVLQSLSHIDVTVSYGSEPYSVLPWPPRPLPKK